MVKNGSKDGIGKDGIVRMLVKTVVKDGGKESDKQGGNHVICGKNGGKSWW